MSNCRVCGCSDFEACQTPTGPCHWVEPDLCSACAGRPAAFLPPITEETALALQSDVLFMRLTGVEALMLLSVLQLATRHPKFEGATREWVEQFTQSLAARLTEGTPAVAPWVLAGFETAFDGSFERSRIVVP